MNHKILVDAAGSLSSAYLIRAICESSSQAIACDVKSECHASFLASKYFQIPISSALNFWPAVLDLVISNNINLIFPVLDETIQGWSDRANELAQKGHNVCVSPPETVRIFNDKWKAYLFFKESEILTPQTSLSQEYLLVKPRKGRGSSGISLGKQTQVMEGKISQEFIEGIEYTVDVLCDLNGIPVYVVPRRRMLIHEGKSTAGIVEQNTSIETLIRKICSLIHFIGPINIQLIITGDNKIYIIEVNPRISAGLALSMEATENWIPLLKSMFLGIDLKGKKTVKYGKQMYRYYAEVFV